MSSEALTVPIWSDPEDVVPARSDGLRLHLMARDLVQRSVVGFRVEALESRPPDIRKARTELVAEEPEQAEDDVARAGGVRHDLGGPEAGLLLKEAVEDENRIAQRSGNDDSVEAGKLVGREVVVRDAALLTEVPRIGSGVHRPNRGDETKPVGGGHLTPSPGPRERNPRLGVHKAGIGAREGLPRSVGTPPQECA